MPRNGSGSYSLTSADNPNVAGALIQASKMNNTLNDIASALTASIANDGQTAILANLPMSTYKHTGVGDGSALTEYASIKNVQNGTPIWCGTAGGSANALTLTSAPAITAYVAGQTFRFISASANTTASTVAVSGLTTKAIQANGVALVANDILSGKAYQITYDGTAFQLESSSNRTLNSATLVSPAITGTSTIGNGCTLTTPVITSPSITGTVGGSATYTTPTISSPTITGTPIYARLKSILNLLIQNNSGSPTSKLDITANSIATQNYLLSSVSMSVDITISGAGGLDTGAEAGTTWYYIYVIYKPSTATTNSLLSLSSSSPTLPSGYTEWTRIGAIKNDGSSNFYYITQIDHNISYLNGTLNTVIAHPVGTTVVTADLSRDIPAIGKTRTQINIYNTVVMAGATSCYIGIVPENNSVYGNAKPIQTCTGFTGGANSFAQSQSLYVMTSTSQQIGWFINSGSSYSSGDASISVLSYYDPLN